MTNTDRGKVVEIINNNDGCLVRIEANCLYVGGGGQPCDKAVILQNGKSFTLDQTKEINGIHYWISPSTELTLGEVYISRNNLWHWELSQQHSVQHIFSSLALRQFGWKSDGFCIFPENSKIELVGADLDRAKYDWLEGETNHIILQGYPIKIYEAKPGDSLRKADNPDHTRVVEIENIDKCCCSGTHVDSTDQIGCFAILQVERKNKDSVRVTFGAGLRLSGITKQYVSWERDLKNKLKGDIDERVDILIRENEAGREQEKELIQIIAGLIPLGVPVFKQTNLPLDLEALKYLSLAIDQRGITSSLINKEGYFVLSGPESGTLFEELKQKGAKGGGKGVITGKLP
jgi:alanyl-tRNA synthetase